MACGAVLGFGAMIVGAAVDYRIYRKFAIPLLILGVILLALLFTPLGHSANNATRWIAVGSRDDNAGRTGKAVRDHIHRMVFE